MRIRKRTLVSMTLPLLAALALGAWVRGQEPSSESPQSRRPTEAWPQPEAPTPAYRALQEQAHRRPSGALEGSVRLAPIANPAR